ncbi:hypothetical protein K438DRAFT_2137186 [Mycena galopus ATCC 62051]|nr:hypothetical protein K438DRAFT_2137186 [Mycena galopus ATCC 62051]
MPPRLNCYSRQDSRLHRGQRQMRCRHVTKVAGIPFVGTICALTLEIVPMVQNTKFQNERCLRIVNDIHRLLCALVTISIHSEDIQPPWMLKQIAECNVTLQKIDSCLRAQQELGTIKRLFKQNEITGQLQSCERELGSALSNFTMNQGLRISSALADFNIEAEEHHQEILELWASQSGSFDSVSSIGYSSFNTSSGSFSLLPACPKIFHGRNSELEHLVESLVTGSARIAILGPGGMGKTTLAVAALHHSKVADKYLARHFISCDSAHTNDSLITTIAIVLGLEASMGSARHIIHHLSTGPPCLLVLDNFETIWEPVDGRAKVEQFLGLLTDVTHVTMRGAERPGTVQWTHPFLRPLTPLTQGAARQTFIEIADEVHNDSELDHLLGITDNIPLAVQLIATVVASEGSQATLERWSQERTSILSGGYDKRSNLEISITLSLSSPRMQLVPQAADLLSLIKPPILDLQKCKTTLLRTSLAYVGGAKEFKVLAPVREYIQMVRPPPLPLVRPVRKHFNALLKLWSAATADSLQVGDLTLRLVSNLGNLHSLLQHGLDSDRAEWREVVQGLLSLTSLDLAMNRGLDPLLLRLPEILGVLNDHGLSGQYISRLFETSQFYTIIDPEKSLQEAIEHFRVIEDLEGEARLYNAVAGYYGGSIQDHKKARDFHGRALSIASQCNSDTGKLFALLGLTDCSSKGKYLGELNSIRWQAMCSNALGDFKHSVKLLQEAKLLIARAGLQGGHVDGILMNTEAEAYQSKTEYVKAQNLHKILLHQTSPLLSPIQHAYSLINIAHLDIVIGGNKETIFRSLDLATSTFRNLRFQRGISVCEASIADWQLREGDVAGALERYTQLFAGVGGKDHEIAYHCLAKLADPRHSLHADEEIARWATVFLAFTMRSSARNMLAVHQSRAECMQTMGDLYLRRGEISKASILWREAKPLFQKSLQGNSVAEIDGRLAQMEEHHQTNLDQLSELTVSTIPMQNNGRTHMGLMVGI